ncbi:hypothetical protein MVEN_00729500 [Mycena venus]|uniref:Uncharacterized protein n=1 Tax=Mycena venus TaxID=2733690 RepID=A0A8H6YKM5_9AGAR|nr:hypothetical protein MVEN_00729500 [Mycena venus]
MPHRTEPHSSSGRPNKRSPVECTPPLPLPNSSTHYSGGDLPIMGPTPPWLKRRKNQPELPTPSPPPLPSYALPPPEIISVPPQAKYLTVVPPDPDEEEEAVLRTRASRTKGSKYKGKPQNMNITVVPASRPIALVTAHTPAAPPLTSGVYPRPGSMSSGRSAPGTPYSPEPSPYIDPGLSRGIPRALGMQAFPTRAERPWRHGG